MTSTRAMDNRSGLGNEVFMTLKVDNLSASRGGVPVIEGVSFTLVPGEARLLRGPNGSGKTTLLRTLAGLQPATGGEIEVNAESVIYAGHLDGLKGTLSVSENLTFWAQLFGGDEIGGALDDFNLCDLRDRPAQNLSAGQKRRLGLARLLVTGRKVWLLDEPTVSLDAASTELFTRIVTAHLNAGGSALIASHIGLGLEAKVLDMAAFAPRSVRSDPFGEVLT